MAWNTSIVLPSRWSLIIEHTVLTKRYISGEKYIQHNLGAPDGREGFLSLFEIPGVRFKVNVVRAFEDGKVVEHWDTIEEIPARENWKNDNGKF